MIHLKWALDRGFIDYVAGLPDGSYTVVEPAEYADDGFLFPQAAGAGDELQFLGSLRFWGYGGMLDIELRDPWIENRRHSPTLTVATQTVRTTMLDLAVKHEPAQLVWHTTLRAEVMEWFGGAYAPGKEFGSIRVVST